MEPELLSIRDLSIMLGFKSTKLWMMRKEGKLPPSVKVGGSIRWTRASIISWINNGCRTEEEVKQLKLEEAKKKYAEGKANG